MYRRAGISTFEFLLIVATLSLAALIIVPSIFRVRDEVAVERTARILADLNIHISTNETSLLCFSGDDRWPWPPQARQVTFDYDTTNGASVVVSLKSGDRRVTATDATGLK